MHDYDTPATVGGSSLLVIFGVLCLTVFALLGLSIVQAEGRLSNASFDAVKAYYEADANAEKILAQLRQGNILPEVQRDGDIYIYECKVSEVQTLEVEVKVIKDEYQILRWQVVSTATWEENNDLNLWNGNME